MQAILEMLGSVGFNWHVALANFVNFLIILYLLNRFIFKKIGITIDNRDQLVKQGLLDAQEAGHAKREAEEKKQVIVKQAEVEAHTIVNDAYKKAELLAADIKDKATRDANDLIQEAALKKEKARADGEKELRAQAPALVASLVEKALRDTMTKDINDSIVASVARS